MCDAGWPVRGSTFYRVERVSVLPEPKDLTWRDIAYPGAASRLDHYATFVEDGRRFDVWLRWDGRAQIECDGAVVLRMWAPAADVFRGIKARREGSAGTGLPAVPGSEI